MFEVFEEGEGFSVFQISVIVTMSIRFSFKRDVSVGLVMVAVLDQAEKPFYHVKDVKRNEKQFTLLGSVDALMVYYITVNP